jgi:hypothetical protein
MGASRNFIWDFLDKIKLKIVKTISAHLKRSVLIFKTLKNIHIVTLFFLYIGMTLS